MEEAQREGGWGGRGGTAAPRSPLIRGAAEVCRGVYGEGAAGSPSAEVPARLITFFPTSVRKSRGEAALGNAALPLSASFCFMGFT